MPGDYDRVADQALRHISTALIQQGRVHLASDWNALAKHAVRRWTTQAHDTFGDAAVPATTANAFALTALAGLPLDMSIGAGRCYVDGLQAEAYVGETVAGAPLSYRNQPFYPKPPDITGSGLVFLDVWEREITAVEEPGLLDSALEGVDTATRLQTAWQVRLLANTPSTSYGCDADFSKLFPPSAGLLSSRAVGPVAAPDPCILPDQGGYRGIENRLYRVEIHKPGDASVAKWKWSRENASIVANLLGTDATAKILTLDRIGRDAVLRFKAGDWVEITNDVYELQDQPGFMARIGAPPDETQATITIDRALPADLAGPDPKLHPRVIRWDQSQGVDGDGLLPITSGWTELEDGVQVLIELDPSASVQEFNLRDHWAFAARTPDASVETLVKAPPLGPRQHYMALAPYSVSGSTLTIAGDCRIPWPPASAGTGDCACTVCVSAQDQQQDPKALLKAIETIRKTGGRLCLTAGVFPLAEPLVIEGLANVIISGQGPATILLFTSNAAAVTLTAALGVRIQDLCIVAYNLQATSDFGEPVGLVLRSCAAVTLERCVVAAINPNRMVKYADIKKVPVADSKLVKSIGYTKLFLEVGRLIAERYGCMAVAIDGFIIECALRDNLLFADIGVGESQLGTNEHQWNEFPMVVIAGLDVSSNLILSQFAGIALFDLDRSAVTLFLLETSIARNQMLGNSYCAILCDGLTDPGAVIRIHGNMVETKGAGIAIGADGAKVSENTVTQADIEMLDQQAPLAGAPGIFVFNPYGSLMPIFLGEVTGNRIDAFAGPGIFIDGLFVSLSLSGNEIAAVAGAGIGTSLKSLVGAIAVRTNRILGVASPVIGDYDKIAGIAVVGAFNAVVDGNLVSLINNSDTKADVVGVAMLAVETGVISDNILCDLGVAGSNDQTTTGILAGPIYADLTIDGNTVRQFSIATEKPGSFHGIRVVPKETASTQSVSIADNVVEACTNGILIEVSNANADPKTPTGGCVISANRCRLLNIMSTILPIPVIGITADTAIVANNWVECGKSIVGLMINVPGAKEPKRCTIVGNVVPNEILVNQQSLPSRWQPVNEII